MLCESKGNLESSFELTYQTKRQLTLIGFALRRFAAGLDYMIIIPTVWFYLESFNCRFYFLGLVIAADSLVAFFLSPAVERLAEKWRRLRFLGFLANLLQIGGSLIYALPLNFCMPLVGRLVSGMGESFGGALYGEIRRVTSPEERNRVMIIMEGVRLFAIVIGPGINFFLKNFDLEFGPWDIDHRTAPGFFMAIVWLLVEVVHIFTVCDLPEHPLAYERVTSDVDGRRRSHDDHALQHGQKNPFDDEEATSDEEIDDNSSERIEVDEKNRNAFEMTRLPKGEAARSEAHSTSSWNFKAENFVGKGVPENERGTHIRNMLGRSDVMLILVAQFLMFFNQTAFETQLLLIGIKKLDFNINILSTVYILAGVEMVTVIIIIWSANKRLDAKYLLLTCLSAGILASFARLAVAFTQPHSSGCLAMTLLMGFFTIIGTPITSISGKSLLPKITRAEGHGFYQSAFATAQHLGLVTGPLVSSVLYNYLVWFSSVTVVVFLVFYMMSLTVLEKLDVRAKGCGK